MKKNIILLLSGVAMLLAACTTQAPKVELNKVGVPKNGDCLLQSVETKYQHLTIKQVFTYNADSTISEVSKYVNDMLERTNKLEYDPQHRLSKLKLYVADTLTKEFVFEWFADSVMISAFDIRNNALITSTKEIMVFNQNNEVTESALFASDSNNVWSRTGTVYLYAWDSNLMKGARNYVDVSIAENAEENFQGPIVSVSVNDTVYKTRQGNADFEVYFDARFTYSQVKNPFRSLSIAGVLPAVLYNVSDLCPSHVLKSYSSGEVISLNSTFETNSQNFPVKETISYLIDDRKNVTEGTFVREYVYTNCNK